MSWPYGSRILSDPVLAAWEQPLAGLSGLIGENATLQRVEDEQDGNSVTLVATTDHGEVRATISREDLHAKAGDSQWLGDTFGQALASSELAFKERFFEILNKLFESNATGIDLRSYYGVNVGFQPSSRSKYGLQLKVGLDPSGTPSNLTGESVELPWSTDNAEELAFRVASELVRPRLLVT